ncbi:MAG: PQQ-binding-like beta-propeller repeat protein, partial [Candidatus Sumerlaeota bacterium]
FNTGGAVEGSTVIGRDGTAYIGSASGWLYAIDTATGEEKWKYAYDERQPSRQPVMTSPGLAHGVVFAGFGKWGGAYVGVDAETGKAVWKLRGRSPNDGLLGPTVDGTTFYAPVNDNVLMAADIRTEIPLENFDNSGHHCKASVAILGDHLFYQRGPALKIARKTDGRKLAELYLREAGLSFFPQSGPTATEDRGYVAKGNNVLYCLDIKGMPTLPEIWNVDLPAQVRSSLGLAGNTLYFGCDDGNVYALDRHTGKKRWNFKTDGPVASSPWIDQGAVYVGSEDGFVYALK